MIIVEQKYIKEIIESGNAVVASNCHAKTFNDFLCSNKSWDVTGKRIDWRSEKSHRIPWVSSTEETVELFIKKSSLNNYDYVCVIYGIDQPTLFVSFDFLTKDLDVLMCHGSGTRFLVAAKKSQEFGFELINNCFIEVDGERWLTTADQLI